MAHHYPLPETQRTPRRRVPYWLVWGPYVLFSLFGWMRMVDSITRWYWLNFAGVAPGPLYLAVTGGLWGAAGLAAAAWLLFRRPGCRQVGMAVALFFALTYWGDRLLASRAPGSQANTVFALVLTAACLGWAFFALRPLEKASPAGTQPER